MCCALVLCANIIQKKICDIIFPHVTNRPKPDKVFEKKKTDQTADEDDDVEYFHALLLKNTLQVI